MYYEDEDYKISKIGEGDTYKVLVKATGEITTATPDIVRVLWSSNIAVRRAYNDDRMAGVISLTHKNEDGCAVYETIPNGGERDVEDKIIYKSTIMAHRCKLTTKQQKVYNIHFLEERSIRETAEILNMTVAAVQKSVKRIKVKLTKNS